ncbi:little elongation complex subunit 1 [Eurosta solidaginis]|uniref:little elongation complex subunit 1 n=1 Tax=Eurosta solidaginis TaxID=178769 RepID=UPI003530A484
MAEEDRTFNYNDLNLDFLELSPPRAKPVIRNVTPIPSTQHFRSNAFKAKQLSQKVAQNDLLVTKIELLNRENTAMRQKLNDFQNSASQIQELYENEKKKCSNLQDQFNKVELNLNKIQKRSAQLHNDLEEKKLQLEQLQAQIEEDKGPLTYTELAMKYLKLYQHFEEEEILTKQEKTIFSDLSKYCEAKGCKSALLRLMKVKKKRTSKNTKNKDVQCNLLEAGFQTNPKERAAQSTQTSTSTSKSILTQTADLPLVGNKQTQTLTNNETKPLQVLLTQGVQTTPIELRSQGTQHITITTTRGTSTSCFIKKHNVSTCFPEPNFVSPVTVMVEELLQLYNVSPLSPISDPVTSLTTTSGLQDIPTTPIVLQEERIMCKSVGTCTYLCNVQRQIDFIPIYASIKRSKSNSPSPACSCVSIKNEAYATPTPSPPLPRASPSQSPRPQVSTASSQNRSASDVSASLNDNLNNMNPMLTAFTQLPEIQPEVFSTIWQMAGQMVMGLLYAPTSNRIRSTQLNSSNNSIDQQQFHNWLYNLYESIQLSPQQGTTPGTATSSEIAHSECPQNAISTERTFELNSETSCMNRALLNNIRSTQEEAAATQEVHNDSINASTNSIEPIVSAADESTQTELRSVSSQSMLLSEKNRTDCIFKEPLEIPKKSAKQAQKRKTADEELTYMKKCREKQIRKKRKKEKKSKVDLQVSASSLCYSEHKEIKELNTPQKNELDLVTAVEFCANLSSFTSDADDQTNQNDNNAYICTTGSSTENRLQMLDLSWGELECDTSSDAKKIGHCEADGRTNTERADASNVQVDLINNNFKGKEENVPDVELSCTAKNKCDSSDNMDTLNSGVAESAGIMGGDTAYRISVGCHASVEQSKDTINNLFGSDTEDEKDFPDVYAKDVQKNGNDESFKVCLDLEELASKLNINDMNVETMSLEKYHDNPQKEKNVSYEKSTHDGKIETIRNVAALLPSVLINQSNVLMENGENRDEINSLIAVKQTINSVEQILLDLSMSESEDEENNENSIVKSSDNNKNEICVDESEEADESVLVIVEEDFEGKHRKRTTSETSFVSDGQTSKFVSPAKSIKQKFNSTEDISALLNNTLVDNDLLGSTYAQQPDEVDKEIYSSTPSRTRGRKRKAELTNVTFSKLCAHRRGKQVNDSDYSSDESLSPPSKKNLSKDSNNLAVETVKSTFINCGTNDDKNSLAASPLKNNTHLNTLHASQTSMEPIEHIPPSNILNATCNNLLSSCSELNEPTSKICARDFQSPASLPNTTQNYLESPSSPPPLETDISNTFQRQIIPLELKGSYYPKNYHSHINHKDYESRSSPPNIEQNNCENSTSDHHSTNIANNIDHTLPCVEIPLELNIGYYPTKRRSILHHIINNYSADIYAIVTGKTKKLALNCKIALQLENFLKTTRDRVDLTASTVAFALHEEIDDTEVIADLIVGQLMNAPRSEIELNCDLACVPPKYIGTHLRLISIMLRHLQYKRSDVAGVLLAKIENKLFNYQNNENIKMEAALNLTQLYLLVIPMHKAAQHNPARLFIAKSLYYYNVLAHPIIYEVLLWYPTSLPSREETHYDRSDALITVIQHFLMCTTYNMDAKDLRHKELLSLLRFEYHFEPFKPKALEVLTNLVSKLKAGQLSNLKYAFAIFCKRQTKLVDILLQQQLLPLADEYYKLVQNTDEYDERIAALLECISAVVKPLPLDTDVSLYHSIFERFLAAVQRPIVQEAAVLAIVRLQRFGQNRCFHALAHFRPHYSLQLLTSNVLKTFIHKKPLSYWNSLLFQNKQ